MNALLKMLWTFKNAGSTILPHKSVRYEAVRGRLETKALKNLARFSIPSAYPALTPNRRELSMGLTRRQFFKVGTGSAAALLLGFDARPVLAEARTLKIARTTETRSTCPYCSVSCGVIIHTLGDKAKNVTAQVVHVEGDPDHPINRGTLCPKGASLYQDILNDRRLLK